MEAYPYKPLRKDRERRQDKIGCLNLLTLIKAFYFLNAQTS